MPRTQGGTGWENPGPGQTLGLAPQEFATLRIAIPERRF